MKKLQSVSLSANHLSELKYFCFQYHKLSLKFNHFLILLSLFLLQTNNLFIKDFNLLVIGLLHPIHDLPLPIPLILVHLLQLELTL
jgi:hypothetical protein